MAESVCEFMTMQMHLNAREKCIASIWSTSLGQRFRSIESVENAFCRQAAIRIETILFVHISILAYRSWGGARMEIVHRLLSSPVLFIEIAFGKTLWRHLNSF